MGLVREFDSQSDVATYADVLSFPGSSPESKRLVEHLLEEDREAHHCLYGLGFHNHLSHHLLAAYDFGATPPLLQAIVDAEQNELLDVHTDDIKKKTILIQEVKIDERNWTQFLGQDRYYANLATFFTHEVKRLGGKEAYEHYIFSNAAHRNGAYMLERFVAGAVHPLIQIGYAFEFNSDAMVAQALAQAAIHDAFHPDLFPWNVPYDIPETQTPNSNGHVTEPAPNVPPRLHARGETILSILRQMYDSEILTPVLPYDPNALLSQRRRDALTPARTAEIRRLAALWSYMPDLTPTELAERTEELFFVTTLLFAGTGRAGRKPRLDFFLMHMLNSTIFVPALAAPLRSDTARAQLLTAQLTVVLAYVLLRGRPRVDPELLMSYTAVPLPPSLRAAPILPGGPTPGALGDPTDHAQVNPWPALITHVLPARDAHTIKALRALYVGAQRYADVPAGAVIGAVDCEGRETHKGARALDGTVFVRAAGVMVDNMGWVGPGEAQEAGAWDRSALGWDAAWVGSD
ncbi:hypothetical protein EVG20_g7157 [Dentipellis fragilis]|uniref:Oxidoreductase AflY n=1 Tax=Dentipellis fragilis TaxID=205917 RepID=A0A4Y9YHI4_9AGAM|nr:hypothetical protein EVG20_g7157 [Dentipellis fragilis]